ncbi:MAG: hypothetical protein SF069_03795 [Phycisphaerae bacterium]|nr:hypothetical protein [Phycisphaerae bacterium]
MSVSEQSAPIHPSVMRPTLLLGATILFAALFLPEPRICKCGRCLSMTTPIERVSGLWSDGSLHGIGEMLSFAVMPSLIGLTALWVGFGGQPRWGSTLVVLVAHVCMWSISPWIECWSDLRSHRVWWWELASYPGLRAMVVTALAMLAALHACLVVRNARGGGWSVILLTWCVTHLLVTCESLRLWPPLNEAVAFQLTSPWIRAFVISWVAGHLLIAVGAFARLRAKHPTMVGLAAAILWGHAPKIEAQCAACAYSLIGLASDRCPECGTPIVRRVGPGASTA